MDDEGGAGTGGGGPSRVQRSGAGEAVAIEGYRGWWWYGVLGSGVHSGGAGLARQIEHFLRKLAPHRRRDDLARIHHAARQGDDAVIRADDGGDLQPAARQ